MIHKFFLLFWCKNFSFLSGSFKLRFCNKISQNLSQIYLGYLELIFLSSVTMSLIFESLKMFFTMKRGFDFKQRAFLIILYQFLVNLHLFHKGRILVTLTVSLKYFLFNILLQHYLQFHRIFTYLPVLYWSPLFHCKADSLTFFCICIHFEI